MLIKIYDHYPLHVTGALAKIGKAQDLSFLEEQLATYKGPGRAEINKDIKKMKKRLAKIS
jgi:hypothetical protein